MKPLQAELDLAREVARGALEALALVRTESTLCEFVETLPREMKAATDRVLDDIILKRLLPIGRWREGFLRLRLDADQGKQQSAKKLNCRRRPWPRH